MSKLSADNLVSLRTAHLGMIQGVIARMSGYSATAKNFAVTACVAIVAVAFDKQTPEIIWVALVGVVAFLCMDGYYLTLERRYRDLYNREADRPIESQSDMSLHAPTMTLQTLGRVVKSASLLPFYGPLLVALVVSLYVTRNVDPAEAHASAVGHSSGTSETLAVPKRIGQSVEPSTSDKKRTGDRTSGAQ